MRQSEIESLEVSAELDSLIEYYVFDKTKSMYFNPEPYSSTLLSAWSVFTSDKFITREIEFSDMREGYERLQFTVKFKNKNNVFSTYKMYGESAPEAICKAALLALTNE
jgi:hypothetical protein